MCKYISIVSAYLFTCRTAKIVDTTITDNRPSSTIQIYIWLSNHVDSLRTIKTKRAVTIIIRDTVRHRVLEALRHQGTIQWRRYRDCQQSTVKDWCGASMMRPLSSHLASGGATRQCCSLNPRNRLESESSSENSSGIYAVGDAKAGQ